MKSMRHKILKENLELVKKTINYFLAELTNTELSEEIKKVAIEQENKSKISENLIKIGYFSISDFITYLSKTQQMANGIPGDIMALIMDTLAEEGIVNLLPEHLAITSEKRFKAGGEYAKFLQDRDLILNMLCGWNFLIEKYGNSVFKIEHTTNNGDVSIGTGFYFAAGNSDFSKYLIITNKHVLENAFSIKIYSKEDTEINYSSIKLDTTRDLGFIELEKSLNIPIFHFNPAREILAEILTIGYPSIPMTKQAYQVYHKGELNSFVEDYSNNNLFLFSAKTSSGNSGSPIIDRYGMVLGIVTMELFEEEQFFKKGKLPYYAGIPTEEIINSLNKVVF